ncbi:MAG: porin [Gammaproteobacteria bacterium]|nr:porin [Gammaproteobacteria bacterium]MBU1506868.1 porin [Gammaproteobacteria bacterium]MBU2121930.1 porin [Gammaproteobacteria bacterium]MBU2172949.1 porin [Gammaproteobacteria bacterium]MBU2198522.1 porin [Gammaproteobacteria bacterium]
MKKSLIALAVLAASGAAMAQSSVTLFGIVDATYAYGSGSVANKSQLTNSGYNSSRLGFRGVEDLGGGMSASFWLEAGVNNDNGSGGATSLNNQGATTGGGGLTFNRRSTVSLNGGFGEVRLGRDYTPQFWNLTVFDPFGTNGVGTTQTLSSSLGGPTTVRASNAIGYFLPGKLGGFYGQAQYYMGENLSNAANKKDGNGLAARVGYANGPINVALALSETKFLAGDIQAFNLGASYDLGMAKIMAHYNQDEIDGGAEGKGFLIGGLIPMGAGEIRLAYSTYKVDTVGADPRSNKLALGYVHNLSKRTALYATYAHVSNKNGAASSLNGSVTGAGNNSNGYDFGVRHSF